MSSLILAGDIGGTKTNLGFFSEENGNLIQNFTTYISHNYKDLASIVQDFLKKNPLEKLPAYACFAIAGPVKEGTSKATNLPWIVDAKALSKSLSIPHVFLINDLEANAYALEILEKDALLNLHEGKKYAGNQAVISPGTGLGEAGLYWDGKRHHPFATEGGHAEFGPRDEVQIDLCRYIYQKYGHASYERVLSGPGLHNIYLFFKEVLKREEPSWLKDELNQEDPAKVITRNALNSKSEVCSDALNLFVSIFGSEASNLVLKFMALAGVFLGGGIPPKILPRLKESIFHKSFIDKGRFRELLEEIPIWVILDDKASLKGAAHFCRRKAAHSQKIHSK